MINAVIRGQKFKTLDFGQKKRQLIFFLKNCTVVVATSNALRYSHMDRTPPPNPAESNLKSSTVSVYYTIT